MCCLCCGCRCSRGAAQGQLSACLEFRPFVLDGGAGPAMLTAGGGLTALRVWQWHAVGTALLAVPASRVWASGCVLTSVAAVGAGSVISLIESNSVVIIHGATGSGKSTQLPQYILDHYVERSAYCNIVVTQPRKIGASSIARWISRERAWTLGGLVGYQVGLEKVATEDTKLVYVTTGVLLQKVVGAKSLMEFTHVFIDEVHERTEEMDFLLLVVRKLLRTNSRFVKPTGPAVRAGWSDSAQRHPEQAGVGQAAELSGGEVEEGRLGEGDPWGIW
ncbi:hypothetical protein CB1_001049004 [Camelus ferus]|nr:hypothetical protein CB1_001049004 [Camelus ferus]